MTPRRASRRAVVVAAAALGVAGLGVWAVLGDVPFLGIPRPPTAAMDAYLDFERPALREIAREARQRESLVSALADHIRAAHPGPATLWRTQASLGSPAAAAAWDDGRQVTFVNFPPWPVPADPDWSEDPYANISWQFYYHSLGWLQAPARGWTAADDPQPADEVLGYVLDWIADNPQRDPPSVRSWYDHAVAYRTDTLVDLFPMLAQAASPEELQVILRALQRHGTLLHGYLAEPRFEGHNHSLFHALSLYNLATALPDLLGSQRWRADGRARVSALLGEMVDRAEAVSREQASSYHYLAIGLFVQADEFLALHGEGLTPDERHVLAHMVEWAALLAAPDGSLPAMGDTSAGAAADLATLRRYQDAGLSTPWSEYLLSGGAEGERPPDAIVRPATGYALLRAAHGEPGESRDDLHLLVDMSDVLHSHGHRDAMNILLTAAGGPLLVDSGGPFVYGDRRHADFVATRAHNTVVVDGADQASGSVSVTTQLEGEGFAAVEGEHALFEGVTHRRLVVLLKPDVVVVLDRLQAVNEASHDYELLYHLPPGSEAATNRLAAAVETEAGAAMALAVASSADAGLQVVSGQENPALGWVTTEYLVRVPAPVLRYAATASDAWFVTAIVTGPSASVPPLALDATERDGSLAVQLGVGDRSWALAVPPAGGGLEITARP